MLISSRKIPDELAGYFSFFVADVNTKAIVWDKRLTDKKGLNIMGNLQISEATNLEIPKLNKSFRQKQKLD